MRRSFCLAIGFDFCLVIRFAGRLVVIPFAQQGLDRYESVQGSIALDRPLTDIPAAQHGERGRY
jgi:hypothetical protein